MAKRGTIGDSRKPSTAAKQQGYLPFEDGAEPIAAEEVSTEQLDSIISLFGDEDADSELGSPRRTGRPVPSATRMRKRPSRPRKQASKKLPRKKLKKRMSM